MSWDPHPLAPEDAPSLDEESLRAQARAWLTYNQNFWAHEEFKVLVDEGPEAAWPMVAALIERAPIDRLAAIGAGILEDMLRKYGSEIIERVEEWANTDQQFRYCLSHVWPDDISGSIWERVVKARGEEPQRG